MELSNNNNYPLLVRIKQFYMRYKMIIRSIKFKIKLKNKLNYNKKIN